MSTRLPRPSRPAGVSAESLLPPRGAAPAPGAGSEMAAAGPDGVTMGLKQRVRSRRGAGGLQAAASRWRAGSGNRAAEQRRLRAAQPAARPAGPARGSPCGSPCASTRSAPCSSPCSPGPVPAADSAPALGRNAVQC